MIRSESVVGWTSDSIELSARTVELVFTKEEAEELIKERSKIHKGLDVKAQQQGFKDYNDLLISNYTKRIKEQEDKKQREQEALLARLRYVVTAAHSESEMFYYQFMDGRPNNVQAITSQLRRNLGFGSRVIFRILESYDIYLNLEYYSLESSMEKKAYADEFITNIYVLLQRIRPNTFNRIWTEVSTIFGAFFLDFDRLKNKGAPY